MGIRRFIDTSCAVFLALIVLSVCIHTSLCICIERERQALLTFKHFLTDRSNRLSSWVDRDCCTWDGVKCSNRTRHVIKLNLRNPVDFLTSFVTVSMGEDFEKARLIGSKVNSSLAELKHLQYLDLSYNDFSFSKIPEFIGNFKSLRYLNLSQAYFRGLVPHSFGNLSNLHALDLGFNDLEVNTLDWLTRLSSLNYLDMSDVNLSGEASKLSHVLNSSPSLRVLNLRGCKLVDFPLSLSSSVNLTSLSILDLGYNRFQGELPKVLQNLTNLETLYLLSNGFTGNLPDWLSQLRNLKYLRLYHNSFSGPIPSFLLPNLEEIDLFANNHNGSIPTSLCASPNLRALFLDSNKLSGPIPYCLGQLSNLEILSLGVNSLVGVVSEVHFDKSSRLKLLDINTNSLVLNVGSNWIPPFQLQILRLASCRIGPEFPLWLQTQNSIEELDISNAGISTSVPNWFWNISSHLKWLDLSHNQLHGSIPTIPHDTHDLLPHFPSKLSKLDLSNNSISGPLPQNLGATMPNLSYIILSRNNINGSIPVSLCEMSNLQVLDLSSNQLSGDLFQYCWSGLRNLKVIDLGNNSLTGVISSSIGHISGLMSLHLSKNRFYGELHMALKNCNRLTFLDLGENGFSGNIPSWIGELSSLQILNLRSNKFDGKIIPQLCHLKNVRVFDLAQNKLSGIIPFCFNNFSAMRQGHTMYVNDFSYYYYDKLIQVIKGSELKYTKTLSWLVNLDISSNNLVGWIPDELTSLSRLTALNLSNNQLTGGIPKEIGNLSSMESLDFSKNKISGIIPQSISKLTKLARLDLSYNNLSGQIPTGNQLQTLGSSGYEGNQTLCGTFIEKKCTKDEPFHAIDSDGNVDKEEFDKVSFYISMIVGTVIGFWGFCGVLFFKKTWRYAYF